MTSGGNNFNYFFFWESTDQIYVFSWQGMRTHPTHLVYYVYTTGEVVNLWCSQGRPSCRLSLSTVGDKCAKDIFRGFIKWLTNFSIKNSYNNYGHMSFFPCQNTPKSMSAQTPLGQLTALLRPPCWFQGGRFAAGGKWRGGEGRTRGGGKREGSGKEEWGRQGKGGSWVRGVAPWLLWG